MQWLYIGARIYKATPDQQGGHGLDRRTNGRYYVDLQHTLLDLLEDLGVNVEFKTTLPYI